LRINILNRWKIYIITSVKFVYSSYRVDQAVVIRFYNSGLSNEIKIHENLAHAIDMHRKGIKLVFIIAKYCNIEVININYNSFTVNYNDHHFPLRLLDIFKSNFEASFFSLILILVTSLSLNLFGVSI